jgi:hypothetical protein
MLYTLLQQRLELANKWFHPVSNVIFIDFTNEVSGFVPL